MWTTQAQYLWPHEYDQSFILIVVWHSADNFNSVFLDSGQITSHQRSSCYNKLKCTRMQRMLFQMFGIFLSAPQCCTYYYFIDLTLGFLCFLFFRLWFMDLTDTITPSPSITGKMSWSKRFENTLTQNYFIQVFLIEHKKHNFYYSLDAVEPA